MKTRCLLAVLATAFLVVAPVAGFSTHLHAAAVAIDRPDVTPGAGLLATLGALAAVGMAIRVKPAGEVARKWVQRAAAAAPDYTNGVKDAAGDWEAATAAAGDNYAQGVNQAIADGRFARGVREAGGAKFAARASTLGAQRFAPGVQASEGAMASGVAPVLQAIAGVTLPPRAPKGDPRNMERANVMAQTLRKLKTGR